MSINFSLMSLVALGAAVYHAVYPFVQTAWVASVLNELARIFVSIQDNKMFLKNELWESSVLMVYQGQRPQLLILKILKIHIAILNILITTAKFYKFSSEFIAGRMLKVA